MKLYKLFINFQWLDLFESDDDENIEDDSDPEISDPDDDEPVKSKRFKGMTNKDFQKKLKGTNSKLDKHCYSPFPNGILIDCLIYFRYEFIICCG